MGIPTHTKFERHLEKIRLAAVQQIENLASQYRASVLLPLCQKFGLSYLTINGEYWFENDQQTFNSDFEVEDPAMAEVKLAFLTLDLPDAMRSHLGCYIEPIRREDFSKQPTRKKRPTP